MRRKAGMAALLGLLLAIGTASAAKQHPPISAPAGEKKEASAEVGGSCASCHADKANQKVVHSAVSQIGCEACHEVSQKEGQWDVKLVAEGNELCLMCHDDKKPPPPDAKIRTHYPVVEGECMGCHDPHGSEYPLMLPGSVEGAGEDNFCFTCHINIQELTKKPTLHPALELGGCLACHQTHKSGDPSEQQFAFHLTDNAPSLCLGCHDGKDEQLAKAHAGQPFQTAACTDCHNPHGSEAAKLIRPFAHYPFAEKMCEACHEEPKDGKVVLVEEGKKELCFTCHDEKQKQLETAKVKHSLFDIDDTCTTCHSPHATDQPRWLKKPVRELCGGCHEEEASFKLAHKPVETAEACAICHEPHASDFPVHLRANVNDLCFTCHSPTPPKADAEGIVLLFDKVALPKSLFDSIRRIPLRTASDRGHPVAIGRGHPVSGENTLIPEMGSISCISCHRPHGVNKGKYMIEAQEKNAPICLKCHGGKPTKAEVKKP